MSRAHMENPLFYDRKQEIRIHTHTRIGFDGNTMNYRRTLEADLLR